MTQFSRLLSALSFPTISTLHKPTPRRSHTSLWLGGLALSLSFNVNVQSVSAQLTCGPIYGNFEGGGIPGSKIREFDPLTNTLGPVLWDIGFRSTGSALSPLLDSNGRRRYFYTDNSNHDLFYFDGVTSTFTNRRLLVPYSGFTIAGRNQPNSFRRMAASPTGDIYILDAHRSFYRYEPLNDGLSSLTTIQDDPGNIVRLDQSVGGDAVFDSNGTLYILTYDDSAAPTEIRLFLVRGMTTGNPIATFSGRRSISQQFGSIAFGSDGFLYLQGDFGDTFRWDLGTNGLTQLRRAASGAGDFGSCNFPILTPQITASKTVTNLTRPNATDQQVGDTLEYQIVVRNTGTLLATGTTFSDAIPVGTTYVPNSTILNGTAIADVAGQAPFSGNQQINSPTESPGVLLVNSTPTANDREATIRFRVTVNTAVPTVCNQGVVTFVGGQLVLTDDPGTAAIADATCLANVPTPTPTPEPTPQPTPTPTPSPTPTPIPPTPTPLIGALNLTKSGDHASAEPGDVVSYTLAIRNEANQAIHTLIATDTLPQGFQLRNSTVRATYKGQSFPITVQQTGSTATFQISNVVLPPITQDPAAVVQIRYATAVTPDALRGTGRNVAIAEGRSASGQSVKDGPATHQVRFLSGQLSNCGTILGRVFVDKNFDGEQQPGEPGIPNAVVFLNDGNRVLTDPNGLFSVANVLPGHHTGVLDLRSVPGYTLAPNRYVTERNSQSRLVRLAPSGMARMNFAVTPSFRQAGQP